MQNLKSRWLTGLFIESGSARPQLPWARGVRRAQMIAERLKNATGQEAELALSRAYSHQDQSPLRALSR